MFISYSPFFQTFNFVQMCYYFFEVIVETALHKWCGKVRNKRSIAATLGNDPLANIVDGIEIKVWHVAHQSICPIVVGKRHLLAWYEFEVAVCTKVNHSIGSESVTYPKIRCNIRVSRSSLNTMCQFLYVVAFRRHRLRQNHHIAKLQTGYCHRSIMSHVFTRVLTMLCRDRINQFFWQLFICPVVKSLFIN